MKIGDIENIIAIYNANKGPMRHLLYNNRIPEGPNLHINDHPAIHAAYTYIYTLKQEKDYTHDQILSQEEIFSLIKCFIDHPVEKGHASYEAFRELLLLVIDDTNPAFVSLISERGNMPYYDQKKRFSVLVNGLDSLNRTLQILNSSNMLTQEIFDAITNHKQPIIFMAAIHILHKLHQLTEFNMRAVQSLNDPGLFITTLYNKISGREAKNIQGMFDIAYSGRKMAFPSQSASQADIEYAIRKSQAPAEFELKEINAAVNTTNADDDIGSNSEAQKPQQSRVTWFGGLFRTQPKTPSLDDKKDEQESKVSNHGNAAGTSPKR